MVNNQAFQREAALLMWADGLISMDQLSTFNSMFLPSLLTYPGHVAYSAIYLKHFLVLCCPIDAISHGGKDMYEKKVEVGLQKCDPAVAGRCNHRMIEQKCFRKRCLWKYEFINLQPAPLLFPFAVLRYVFMLMLTLHHRYHKSTFFINHISACFIKMHITQYLNIVDLGSGNCV